MKIQALSPTIQLYPNDPPNNINQAKVVRIVHGYYDTITPNYTPTDSQEEVILREENGDEAGRIWLKPYQIYYIKKEPTQTLECISLQTPEDKLFVTSVKLAL